MTHQGAFNDGKTAARRNVTLLIDGDALLICRADDGTEAARWPLVEIRRIGTSSERPQRFGKINDDARLTLNTDDDGTWLATACPKLNKRDAGRVRWPVWTGAGVLAVISVLGLVFFLLPGAAALPDRCDPGVARNADRQRLSRSAIGLGRTFRWQRQPRAMPQPGRTAHLAKARRRDRELGGKPVSDPDYGGAVPYRQRVCAAGRACTDFVGTHQNRKIRG